MQLKILLNIKFEMKLIFDAWNEIWKIKSKFYENNI